MDSGGLSWADQWDSNPDPGQASEKDKKGKNGSSISKLGKSVITLKWIKDLRKKSQK